MKIAIISIIFLVLVSCEKKNSNIDKSLNSLFREIDADINEFYGDSLKISSSRLSIDSVNIDLPFLNSKTDEIYKLSEKELKEASNFLNDEYGYKKLEVKFSEMYYRDDSYIVYVRFLNYHINEFEDGREYTVKKDNEVWSISHKKHYGFEHFPIKVN